MLVARRDGLIGGDVSIYFEVMHCILLHGVRL